MKGYQISLVFIFSLLASCRSDDNCLEIMKEHAEMPRQVSYDQLINGISFKPQSWLTPECVFYKNNSIFSQFKFKRTNSNDSLLVALNKQNNLQLQNNDTISIGFVDKQHFFLRNEAKFVKVDIVIKVPITPCDSVVKILLDGFKNNIEKLTDEKVELVQLFDSLMNNTIVDYLNALSAKEKDLKDSCSKTFKLLSWLQNSEKDGFEKKSYVLEKGICQFLDEMAKPIAEKINQNWDYKKFVFKCIGYADQRPYKDSAKILASKMPTAIKQPIVFCGKADAPIDEKFFLIDSTYSEQFSLTTIRDNYTLSVVRAYVAALYFKHKIAELTNQNIQIEYAGGNEIPGGNFNYNRRIEVSVGLRAAR